jgi:hypothetical protein
VFLPDGSFLIVDGNHRYVRRGELGLGWMHFHVAHSPHWHQALIDMAATQHHWTGQNP